MRCITRHIEGDSRADTYRIYALADMHLGNVHSNERALKTVVKEIEADDSALWIGLGDYCEFINMHDPRFDPRELPGWLMGGDQLADIARTECNYAAMILAPIKDKCIGLCSGNHEDAILRHSECDVYARLIEALADGKHEHRLDHRGIVSLVFNRLGKSSMVLTIMATHGSAGGRTQGSVTNRLADLIGQVDGIDLVLQGHAHKGQHVQAAKFRPGRYTTRQVTIHGVTVPAMCADMRYAESKDCSATSEGYAVITITPDKRRIGVGLHAV